MSDLRDRHVPSRWRDLLDRALPILDHVFGGPGGSLGRAADWTLGGGTAIALRIEHRISDDIDLFVGSTDLRAFTPARNPHAARLRAGMEFPGNYLRFQQEEGEIDFLPGPLLSTPGYTWDRFGPRPIALQTCEEVVLKKVRYRSGSFKARDAYDLAAVARVSGTLPDLLISETGDMLPTLLAALKRHDARTMARADIRPLAGFEDLPLTAASECVALVTSLHAAKDPSC